MQTFNSKTARTQFSAALDSSQVEAVEITRRKGSSSILIGKKLFEDMQKELLQEKLSRLFDRHESVFKALADR